MFVSSHHIKVLMECAHWADRLARSDLINGYIADENDYTSNFLANFRREVNSRNVSGLKAVAYRLAPKIERKLGADGCIIIDNGISYKVGIFEAKWPGEQVERSPWDYIQKSDKISHFDTQVKRQSQLSQNFAIWEMFYCDSPFEQQPGGYSDYGSACIGHQSAAQYVNNRNNNAPWSDRELEAMLASSTSIEVIIQDICKCLRGRPLNTRPYENAFDGMNLPQEVLLINSANHDESPLHY
ncbi:hypothetical protein K4W91_21410 [Pseudomonas aeruginosa]|uniref:hypothetical protein n=1 Tax=Pseudomonas aeruginosa TaxID=287 RepID=UPI000FD3743B|nr:hypothetical protein [Pseudomonas aeruginosa]MCD2824301.1 hypothetical protein [Pseudomonas aeruginosa]MCD2830659.1 hypothetical protein [Pseudomonas aeruginosa]RUI01257.1 hypothetical protein IPC449_25030 [Pseudomonas aeruginosa]HCK3347104.1 hypothetical protein [Pseudomonas aeruginosa]HCK3357768.1 hypothetical protein [Pseudomonas aeruginosa]